MRKIQSVGAAAAACLLVAGACLADANVDEKSQVKFGGFMGGMINAFGGKATHEGTSSTTYVKGSRKAVMHDGAGEIIDLDAEKIYYLDYNRKTYRVVTFDELRKQFEEQKARAEKENARDAKNEKKEGPEYEVDFDVKDTGQKQVINGFNTHETVVTVTVHEKGKKVEQSGGVVLTSDMWMGPSLAAMKEVRDFDRKYLEKLYGKDFGAAETQLAVMMATNPAFGKAMKTFSQKSSSLEGTPIKTLLTVESVSGTEQQQQAKKDEGGSEGISAASVIGGFMKKAQQRKQAENGGSANRSKLFDSTVEVTKAATTATADNVAVPAGFTQR